MNTLKFDSDIKVPNELKPQNIEKMLMERDKEKVRKRKKVIKLTNILIPIGAAAAVALFTLGSGALNKKSIDNKENEIKEKTSVVGVQTGYDLAYKRLKSYSFRENLRDLLNIGGPYGIAYLTDDAQTTLRPEGVPGNSSLNGLDTGSLKKITGGNSYSQTNIRTEGVYEGDIVKCDGEHIFVYDEKNGTIRIYLAEQKNAELLSEIEIDEDFYISDMYVSDNKLIYIGEENRYDHLYGESFYKEMYYDDFGSTIVEYDISDKKNPKLMGKKTQEGNYSTSRLVGDKLYLFSKKYIELDEIETKDDLETYVPCDFGGLIAEEDVVIFRDIVVPAYTVVSVMDIDDMSLVDSKAILGGESLYMSSESIFLFGYNYNNDKTKVIKLSYEDGTISGGIEGAVLGRIKDDYSIDEYNSYLRVVTTYTNKDDYKKRVALIVLDKELNECGRIDDLAKNENVKSARFMGDKAYFVTFVNTDPLFSADLSDPNNPKIVGEIKLPGYSAYLHPVGENMLLGIGYETVGESSSAIEGVKVSLFDISDMTNVVEVDKLVLDDSIYTPIASNPNALLINEEEGYIGMPIMSAQVLPSYYAIIDYDKDGLKTDKIYEVFTKDANSIRGVYIDNYLYIIDTFGDIICDEKN